MLLRHLHLFHSFFIAIIFAYDYRKNFQAFQHESVADIIADFAPETEEDDFKLEHVLSGKEALQMERGIKTTNNVGSLPFEMSLLQYPKASGKAFPTHRIKFTSGLGSFLQEYSEKPADFAEALSRFSAAPGILPRPDDHETVKNFALMCSNAYIIHSILGDWRNITDWEQTGDFGWDGTGLRGYIFTNRAKTIVIVAFKGTSTLFGGGDTVAEDKYIDNLMFSCCCARVDISWTPVCGCYLGSNRCNQTCLEESVKASEISYYEEAKAVVNLVKQRYKRAQLWFTGHSLGGAMAALMAVTYPRTAAITLEAPGAALYGQRLGLHSSDPKELARFPIWNYGISTDPIFLGSCSGLTSTCYLSGYAMESKCRQGQDCLFELPGRLVNINSHRIDWVIENILMKPEKFPLPMCLPPVNCTECEDWTFIKPGDNDTIKDL